MNAVDVDAAARPDPARDIAVHRRGIRVRCGSWTGRAPQDAIAITRDLAGFPRRSATSRRPGLAAPRGGRSYVRWRSARRQSRVRVRTTAGVTMRRDKARWCRAPRDRFLVGDRVRQAAYRRVDGPSLRPVRPWLRLPDSLSVSIIRTGQPYDPAPRARAGRSGGRAIPRRRGGVGSHHVRRIGVSSGACPGRRGESA